MPVIPNDFLDISRSYSSACNEMQLRNSVSRAYYAGYLHVMEKIKAANILLSGSPSGTHDKLINSLNASLCGALCGGMTPKAQSELAGILHLTKQLRTKADYKLNTSVTQSDQLTAIKNAVEIMRRTP